MDYRHTCLPLLLLAASLGSASCGGASRPKPVRVPLIQIAVRPVEVSDADFAAGASELIANGQPSEQRVALLSGVVRRQFARAAQRFEGSDRTRAMQALHGALYLVRNGELRPEMLDGNAAMALEQAYSMAAQKGEEGPALAFSHLRASALPAGSPEQQRIRARLGALSSWARDTRQKSDVENASADTTMLGEQAMFEPTQQTIDAARAVAERWISASLVVSEQTQSNQRGDRDQMIEAYRGMRTGSLAVVGLYLRNGDAEGALRALEAPESRRVTPPQFYALLQDAVATQDAKPWRQMAALYAHAGGEDDSESETPLAAGIARGAMWGSVLEAYRRAPEIYENARNLAAFLPQVGLSEVAPMVLVRAVQKVHDPAIVSDALRLVTGLLGQEDHAQDPASAARVFAAAQALLSFADTVHARSPLDPSPADVRLMMGTIYVRAANPAAARSLLEQAVAAEPSIEGYSSLASVLVQAGDKTAALAALNQGIAAPGADEEPLAVADAQVSAFEIHRSVGDVQSAKTALAAAVQRTLAARSRASNDYQRAACERMLGRLAWFYGDREAWGRSVERMFQFAQSDERAMSMALVEATSTALLFGDVNAAREALQRAMDNNAEDEDVVYGALWLQLAERKAGMPGHPLAKEALESVDGKAQWPSQLAAWGLGKLDDQALLARAKSESQRAEASFYATMRRRASGDATADSELSKLAQGLAIELVETHLARELTTPQSSRPWAPPAAPLP